MPCSDLFIYFFLTLGAKIGNKIGVRLTIIVALLFKYISYAILLFIPNYYAVLAAMCIFGVGSGFGNLTYLKKIHISYVPFNRQVSLFTLLPIQSKKPTSKNVVHIKI